MIVRRNPSFGADVGRDARGRFIKLDRPARSRLEIRLAHAKAQREIEARQTRTFWEWLVDMWRRVWG